MLPERVTVSRTVTASRAQVAHNAHVRCVAPNTCAVLDKPGQFSHQVQPGATRCHAVIGATGQARLELLAALRRVRRSVAEHKPTDPTGYVTAHE